MRCLGVVVQSAMGRDGFLFLADEALCERLPDDVDEGRGMEERFDGSRWSLRWERKGSTRGTEVRARDDGGCEIYGGFPAAARRTHSRWAAAWDWT